MRNIVIIFMLFSLSISSQEPDKVHKGYKLIKSSDCLGCHSYSRRVVGPAFKEVAVKYKDDPQALTKLIEKVRKGGSGNWGVIPMAPHPAFSNEQLTDIVTWVLSGEQPPKIKSENHAIKLPATSKEKIEYKNLIRHKEFPAITHLPPVPIPLDNPMTVAKVELGKKLFFDGRLSGNNKSSCFVCHNPQLGWGDGGAISRGYPGTSHWRNSQTILNAAYYNKNFWAGSSPSLEKQARSAAQGAVGGNGDGSMMEMRLRFIPEYVKEFNNVFGTLQPRMKQAWMAIAAFERTIVSDAEKVPYDRYIKDDAKALSESAKRGYKVFMNKANCISCHNGPLASNQRFYATGVPENPIVKNNPLMQITFRYEQYMKGMSHGMYKNANRDYGLYYSTKNPKDKGKFRVPSLRELKYTAPYMRNGVFATLEEVVDFYNKGGGNTINKTSLLKPLNLNQQEQQDLVEFLKSLSMETPLIVHIPELPEYQVLK